MTSKHKNLVAEYRALLAATKEIGRADAEAEFNLGLRFHHGIDGASQNYTRAYYWYFYMRRKSPSSIASSRRCCLALLFNNKIQVRLFFL